MEALEGIVRSTVRPREKEKQYFVYIYNLKENNLSDTEKSREIWENGFPPVPSLLLEGN